MEHLINNRLHTSFSIQITGKCCNATPMDATLILSFSSSTIVTFPPFAVSENENNQIVISIELEEFLLDRTLQSFMLVTYTNGKVISTVTRNFSKFSLCFLNIGAELTHRQIHTKQTKYTHQLARVLDDIWLIKKTHLLNNTDCFNDIFRVSGLQIKLFHL